MTSTLVSAVVALRMLGRSIDTLGTNLNALGYAVVVLLAGGWALS